MPDNGGLEQAANGSIKVSGRLDVETVGHYKEPGNRMIDNAESPVFDLDGVDTVGTAAVALLIAWQRHAILSDKDVSFINASEALRHIAEACGVDKIIAFG